MFLSVYVKSDISRYIYMCVYIHIYIYTNIGTKESIVKGELILHGMKRTNTVTIDKFYINIGHLKVRFTVRSTLYDV